VELNKEQSAVAASAMRDAQASMESFSIEAEIVRSALADTNKESEEGARQFKELQKQLVELG
jgi:hypothetical protein